jgi:hypothetical protein
MRMFEYRIYYIIIENITLFTFCFKNSIKFKLFVMITVLLESARLTPRAPWCTV